MNKITWDFNKLLYINVINYCTWMAWKVSDDKRHFFLFFLHSLFELYTLLPTIFNANAKLQHSLVLLTNSAIFVLTFMLFLVIVDGSNIYADRAVYSFVKLIDILSVNYMKPRKCPSSMMQKHRSAAMGWVTMLQWVWWPPLFISAYVFHKAE